MKKIIFALPGNESLANNLAISLDAEMGTCMVRQFPDGETLVRIDSDVKNKQAILVCTMSRPDDKLLPLYFLSKTAKDLGAECTCLIVPYLPYMRQDKRFHPGEGISSVYFGEIISSFGDSLVTVDPHLHRRSSLSEIYNIPSQVVHAAPLVAEYIKMNIDSPVLIGPDSESEQWVSEVAKMADAPFTVLNKIRHGDKDVEVSVPDVEKYSNHTPVLVDDIISTARTMIETVHHLHNAGMNDPICFGVHAVFSGDAYEQLKKSGVKDIVTCNTIIHESNKIQVETLLSEGYNELSI